MSTRTAESEVKLAFASSIKNLVDSGVYATASIGQTVVSGKILSGVSASQANRAWELRAHTIINGTTIDIDLYDYAGWDIGAGAGNDALGQTLTIEEIVCLVVKQVSGDGQLEIQPSVPTSGGLTWAPQMTVANGGALRAGACICLFCSHTHGFDIDDGVSHVLRLGAKNGHVVADVYVLGRHDDEESSSSTSSSASSASSSQSTPSSASSSTSSSSTSSVSSGSSSSTSSVSSSCSSPSSASTSSRSTSSTS